MGVPARAAVEAPEGERAPIWRAAAQRMSGASSRTLVCDMRRMVGMRLSALGLPLIAGGESILVRGRSHNSDAQA
jgi:hypothetical protein